VVTGLPSGERVRARTGAGGFGGVCVKIARNEAGDSAAVAGAGLRRFWTERGRGVSVVVVRG
jgi:hypothetical protein